VRRKTKNDADPGFPQLISEKKGNPFSGLSPGMKKARRIYHPRLDFPAS
jgi:hypothetical protein